MVRSSRPTGRPLRRGAGLLDLPTIIDVALGIARAEGLAALSMRRIADELGRSPMALYRHVAGRQSLVLAMLDTVAARIDLPPPHVDPRAEITGLMHAVHAAARNEAWVVTALATEGLASPQIIPTIDRLFGALARAGLRGAAAMSANMLLWEFAYGELLTSHPHLPDSWGAVMVRTADPVAFPALHAVIRDVEREPDDRPRELFGPHLQIVLDGLLGPARHDDELSGPEVNHR